MLMVMMMAVMVVPMMVMPAAAAFRRVAQRAYQKPRADSGNQSISRQFHIAGIVQHRELPKPEDKIKYSHDADGRYRVSHCHKKAGPYAFAPFGPVTEKISSDDHLAMARRQHMKDAVAEADEQQAPQRCQRFAFLERFDMRRERFMNLLLKPDDLLQKRRREALHEGGVHFRRPSGNERISQSRMRCQNKNGEATGD